jgi:hypothetical protein
VASSWTQRCLALATAVPSLSRGLCCSRRKNPAAERLNA